MYFCVSRWRILALLLREDDVRSLLPTSRAVDLLEEVFRMQAEGTAQNQPRQRITYPGGRLHSMAAVIPPIGAAGLKAYDSTRSGAHFVVILYDSENSNVLSLIEADWLGRIRTGAASGLATRLLARRDARVAGVIGAGGQADTQIEALAAVRDLTAIKVFSRSRDRRENLVARLADRVPVPLEPVDSARDAVEGSDIVTVITTAREPVFDGSWLAEGTHVNAAGSNTAERREIDITAVKRADLITVDSLAQARSESGDLIAAVQSGDLDWDRVQELGAILNGVAPGRTGARQITLFESQGVAIEDVMVGRYVYDRAMEAGLGTRVAFGGTS